MMRKVTYAKGWGIFMLACAIFILGTSFVIGVSINTITGAILCLIGILYLSNSAITYNDDEFHMKNLFGGTVKRYSYKDDKVQIRDGNVYSNDKKVSIAKMMVSSGEYNELIRFISEKTA